MTETSATANDMPPAAKPGLPLLDRILAYENPATGRLMREGLPYYYNRSSWEHGR